MAVTPRAGRERLPGRQPGLSFLSAEVDEGRERKIPREDRHGQARHGRTEMHRRTGSRSRTG